VDLATRPPTWILTGASVRGRSHERAGATNQDAHFVLTGMGGRIVAAAVSDGAGTAERSGEGARNTVQKIARALLALGESDSLRTMTAPALHHWAVNCIDDIRRDLADTGVSLAQFHCTLIAAVLSPYGNWVFQLGDSVALCSVSQVSADGRRSWFDTGSTSLYAGDRGQYANETRFITEADFEQHLHVGMLDTKVDTLVLMTDGAMDVAMTNGRVYPGFLPVVVEQLIQASDAQKRDAHLTEWLADSRTWRITGDDKTMVIALREPGPANALSMLPAQSEAGALASSPNREGPSGATSAGASREAMRVTALVSDPKRGATGHKRVRQLTLTVGCVVVIAAAVLAAWFFESGPPQPYKQPNSRAGHLWSSGAPVSAPSRIAAVPPMAATADANSGNAIESLLTEAANAPAVRSAPVGVGPFRTVPSLAPMLAFDDGLAVVVKPSGNAAVRVLLPVGHSVRPESPVRAGPGKVRIVLEGCERLESEVSLARCVLRIYADAAAEPSDTIITLRIADASGVNESTVGLRLQVVRPH